MKPHNRRTIRQYAAVGCVALAWLLLYIPASAGAACQSLPGRSGLDQYCESIPSAGGNQGPGAGAHHHAQRTLSRGAQHRLAGSGSAGQEVIALSQSGPREQVKAEQAARHRGHKAGSDTGQVGNASAPSDNPLSAVRSAVNSGSSVGPPFLWVLLGVVLLVAGLAWLRYRRRSFSS